MEKRTKGKVSDVYFVHPFAPWLFLLCESCLTFLVEKDQCYSHLCIWRIMDRDWFSGASTMRYQRGASKKKAGFQ